MNKDTLQHFTDQQKFSQKRNVILNYPKFHKSDVMQASHKKFDNMINVLNHGWKFEADVTLNLWEILWRGATDLHRVSTAGISIPLSNTTKHNYCQAVMNVRYIKVFKSILLPAVFNYLI